MFIVLTICTLLLICSCSYSEESDFRIDDFLGRRQLFSFWGSKKSKAAPSKPEIPVDKSISATPPPQKIVSSGSFLKNVRPGVELSKEGTYSTVIPKLSASVNQSTTAAINQYFNSTIIKKVSNTYPRAVKPNVTSAVPIPKKPIKLNPNNSTAEKNSAPKVRDTTIKLQGGTYSTIKMKNSTVTTTTTTVPIKAGAKKEKRRFRHRV